jgi:hypothetical protein
MCVLLCNSCLKHFSLICISRVGLEKRAYPNIGLRVTCPLSLSAPKLERVDRFQYDSPKSLYRYFLQRFSLCSKRRPNGENWGALFATFVAHTLKTRNTQRTIRNWQICYSILACFNGSSLHVLNWADCSVKWGYFVDHTVMFVQTAFTCK